MPEPEEPVLPVEPLGAGLPVRPGLAGRLTPMQYRYVVQDLFGVTLDPTELALAQAVIPEEQPSTGLFRNGAEGQAAGDVYSLAFARLASEVARRVDIEALAEGTALPGGACAGDINCERPFIEKLGLRLFRRPLTARELDAFSMLHANARAEGLGFGEACRVILEAMLQSPAFVFRLERELGGPTGEKRYLDGFELASRLAFFLWHSAPDDELLAAAANGTLDGTAEAIPALRAQTARLLADPRARRMTREFVRDFVNTERAVFLGVTPELRAALFESMVASVDVHLWQEGQPFSALFTTTRMSFDPSVAALVGLTPVGEGQRLYDVSSLPERVGWLTHPAFIASLGDVDLGRIVQRGIALMTKLMCRQPVDVPEELTATTTAFATEFAALSERQRSEERRRLPDCWACHSQFEPLAYGFDRFDAAGRYLGELDTFGEPLAIDGWLTDDLTLSESERPRYSNVRELMQLLSESPTVQTCMAEHLIAFATGRANSTVTRPFAEQVSATDKQDSGSLVYVVDRIVTSELFRTLGWSGAP